jgi:hypothetical protein
LHFGRGKAARIGEDGERIAFEGPFGEDVNLGVFVRLMCGGVRGSWSLGS